MPIRASGRHRGPMRSCPVSKEQMSDDERDGFHDLMARSFEQAEFLYLKAKQGCDSDLVVLVASSDDRVFPEASDEFHEDSSYRVFLEKAVIRRRIADNGANAISVMVFPRGALALAFEQNGNGHLADQVDSPASEGKMTILLMKNKKYELIERDIPHES